ncbi:DUF2069 domain-containing protein [Lysobacter sp. A286]
MSTPREPGTTTRSHPARSMPLVFGLIGLAVLYAAWFAPARDWVALTVFGLPPLALGIAAWFGWRTAGFWASVLALAWFSHGIMAAWTRPAELGFALMETLLALVVIFAANLPGLRARFGTRRS